MTHKLFHLFLLVVVCSLFSEIICDLKNKKSIRQNGLRFYQVEPPLEWLRSLVYSGQNRNFVNAGKSLDNLALNKIKAKPVLDLNLKKSDKSVDLFPIVETNLAENQASDEFEPIGATDFEMINFWPGLNKRDTDYGHLRFGRSAELKKPLYKKTLDKKIESDYGHFRFGR